MKIIAAIILVYAVFALLFILAICKAAARRMPPPPAENGDGSDTQRMDLTIHETHV
jgi:hypothetical protein